MSRIGMLDGRVALIMGGRGEIGSSVGRRFASGDAKVVVAGMRYGTREVGNEARGPLHLLGRTGIAVKLLQMRCFLPATNCLSCQAQTSAWKAGILCSRAV